MLDLLLTIVVSILFLAIYILFFATVVHFTCLITFNKLPLSGIYAISLPTILVDSLPEIFGVRSIGWEMAASVAGALVLIGLMTGYLGAYLPHAIYSVTTAYLLMYIGAALLQEGGDVNASNKSLNRTPLHGADQLGRQTPSVRMQISFHENAEVNPRELNHLYSLVGWDENKRRTIAETEVMVRTSLYYVHATCADRLVGFARVVGDPYVAYVMDVITHPEHRRRGVASQCMTRVNQFLTRSNFISVYLLDDSPIKNFYSKFGFVEIDDHPMKWRSGV